MKKVDRLIERLTRDCDYKISPQAKFIRLYPGRHQRCAGAWLWCIQDIGLREIASCETVTDLLKAHRIEVHPMGIRGRDLEVFGWTKEQWLKHEPTQAGRD